MTAAAVDHRLRVTHLIDSLGIGGAERLEVTFADAAPGLGLDLTVVSLRKERESFAPELCARGARVQVIPSRVTGLAGLPASVLKVARILRAERTEVLHTSLTYANVIGAAAGRLTGVPVVATLHGTLEEARRHGRHMERLEAWALRWGTSSVVAVGESVARAHRHRLGAKPVTVVENAVALPAPLARDERDRIRRGLMGQRRGPLLIAVGRMVPEKGIPDLLRAFGMMLEDHPEAVLAIAGRGPLEQDIARRIAAVGLSGRALLLGHREDGPSLLGASDLFVSASLWEALPVAVLEAMASRLPIVATAVGELPLVLADGRGLLVPAGQPHTFAAAVRALLADRSRMLAMGTSAAAYVAQRHGAAAWASRLLAVYHEVLPLPARR